MSSHVAKIVFVVSLLLFSGLFPVLNTAFCLDGKDILLMKKAGLDGPTIQVVIEEKIVETCAFTVDEIMALKWAGVGNATLQQILKNASFLKDAQPIEYTKHTRRIRSLSVSDIIELKKNGISDEIIQSIIAGIRDEDVEARKKSWQMLESMGVVVDDR